MFDPWQAYQILIFVLTCVSSGLGVVAVALHMLASARDREERLRLAREHEATMLEADAAFRIRALSAHEEP